MLQPAEIDQLITPILLQDGISLVLKEEFTLQVQRSILE